MRYRINLDSLHANFPEGFPVPPLLIEFGDWLTNQNYGELGYFDLQSDRFDDYGIENGSDLHPYFAFFLHLPCGGQIGFWRYLGPQTPFPPIIYLGSEGQTLIISDSLEEFFQRVARSNTNLPDLDTDEGSVDVRSAFANWLSSHALIPLQSNPGVHPDLNQWLESFGSSQRSLIDQDGPYLQIAEALRKYRQPDAEAWKRANFDVVIVGKQFKMWHRNYGAKPMDYAECASLEPMFRAIRKERAIANPERGLWFYAWVSVGPSRGATLSCEFMKEPEVLDQRIDIPKDDYKIDLTTFPRSAHWMPDWLLAKL